MITIRNAALILFLEGLASSGLQMITIRQTTPFVGSSIMPTSIVISCFLAALALGYYKGGQQHESRYIQSLVRNLVVSIGFFGIGLSYLFVEFFFINISNLTVGTVFHSPLLHLSIFCLLVMAPLVFCLAQTVPLLLNSYKNTSKSEAAGNATALSTIGNVVGCLLSSLVLMVYFGVGKAIFINCLILASCLFFMAGSLDKHPVGSYCSVFVLLLASNFLNVALDKNLFAKTTAYSNFNILNNEEKQGKRLVINRSSASFITDESRQGWPYLETIKESFRADKNIAGKNILVLGAGGFTLSAETDFGANFTYVDIDPEIKEIAEKLFLQEEIKGSFIANDARRFLLKNETQWDYIVVDLFTHAATIPMHTATIEFFNLVQENLKPDGRTILNIAANPLLNDDYSRNFDHTIRTAFNTCITDLTTYKDTLVNIVYYCQSRNNANPNQKLASVYTDDSTLMAVDGYKAFFSDNWRGY